MAERVIVLCTKSTAGVTPAMLVTELEQADLMTLAESLELPEGEEDAVNEMWKVFRFDGTTLHWHATQRPIQLRRGPPLEGELAEYLEDLPGNGTARALKRVRACLEKTVEVIEFEMGIPGSAHLAATISEVLAFFFAEHGDGLVYFYGREYAGPDDRGRALLKR